MAQIDALDLSIFGAGRLEYHETPTFGVKVSPAQPRASLCQQSCQLMRARSFWQVTRHKLRWMNHYFQALGLQAGDGGWEGCIDPDDPLKIKENLQDLCDDAGYEFVEL